MKRAAQAKMGWGWLALIGSITAAACGDSGVVGGGCADGYHECDGQCVNLQTDERHCGECHRACASGVACNDAVCQGSAGSGGSAGAAGEMGTSTGGQGTSAGGNNVSGGSGGTAGVGTGGASTGGTGGASTGGTGGTGGVGTGGAGTGGTGGAGTGGSGGAGTGGSGGAGTGGSGGTAGVGTGGAGTGGTGGAGTGGAGTGGVPCLPPHDEPSHCGDCETQCSAPNPLCAPTQDDGYACAPECSAGLVQCSSQCVDLDTSPIHCGTCDNICPSGVCVGGNCVGATAGHVVYICMDYEQVFQTSAQTTLLGNAVYLPRRAPVRVLAYSEFAPTTVMESTDRAIRWAGESISRSVDITRTDSLAAIEAELVLANYDVFLVYDQVSAPPDALAAAGTQLEATLAAFTAPGGVAVVLSGGTGLGEMPSFAASAGLADITSESDFTGQLVHNQASGDVIGFGVVTPFLTLANSCRFETTETPSSGTVFVVTDTDPDVGLGTGVVLHKIVTP